jgi:hypothetical protein
MPVLGPCGPANPFICVKLVDYLSYRDNANNK